MGRPAKKRCYAEAKAKRKGELQADLEYHKKKPLLESVKEHIGKMIDNTELLDILTLFSIYIKYNVLDNHSPLASIAEAAVDLALLRTHTDAGTAAVLLHLGITELPNIANLIDQIGGGPGTVWEDFLKVIGLG